MLGCGAEFDHVEAAAFARVGRHNAGATSIREQRNPIAARYRLVRQNHRDIKQLLNGVGANDPGLCDESLDRDFEPCQRARVRTGRARAGCGPPALHRDNGFLQRDAFANLHKARRIPEAL